MAQGSAPTQPGADSSRWLDTPLIREAGRDILSLAFMDARNHTLQMFAQLERGWDEEKASLARAGAFFPPLWLLGEPGWYQERWIARNLQRSLGGRCDPSATRLPSVLPMADQLWEGTSPQVAWQLELPSAEDGRAFLLQTLEGTLELLDTAPESDEGLYFFRLSLLHEDLHSERMVEMAQSLSVELERPFLDAFSPPALARRESLWLPACTWQMGSPAQGFSFDNEYPRHAVPVPEFEIDANPVSWSQFVEFVDDGGYDREEFWSPEGWRWLQAASAVEGRRAPRYVEQIGVASGAVMQMRFGRPTRMSALQPAMHVSWWEADAWCRWAGRRLPLEVEWEIAAESASRRGFRWGDVWEWTASTFRPYPGFTPSPDAAYSSLRFGRAKVLRGGSSATRARLKSPRFRRFARSDQDELFCGFRSCAT